jgi:hypothetical protein
MKRMVPVVALATALLAACTYTVAADDVPDTGIDAGTDVVSPDALDVPGDIPAEPGADVPPDAPADVPADVPDLPLWTGLQGTGLPLQQIAGVASQMDTKAPPNAERDFEYAQYAPYPGFRMRNGHRWEDVEKADGVWTFDGASGSVDGAKAGGTKVLMGLDYAPEWARDGEDMGTVHIDDFASYAGGMAGRFCDSVKEYEVWNEPNIGSRFWQPAADPAKYADLVIASTAAIRAVCPDAQVAFGAMSSYDDVDLTDTWGFLRRALQARPGLCDSFDVLSLHPYTWFQFDPPEHDEWLGYGASRPSQTAMVQIARDMLTAAGCAQKPIWFTEVGWPSYELSEVQVARYAARSLLLTARDGVDAWCWYTFWDNEPSTTGLRPHEGYFGMYGWKGPDNTVRRAKPAWQATTGALDVLGMYRFARDLGPALGLPNDVYVLAFVDDAGQIALALWDGREMPDVTEDGATDGGPDTTYALDLPLPSCATGVELLDQDGAALPTPAAGPSTHIVLTTAVQYLKIACDGI